MPRRPRQTDDGATREPRPHAGPAPQQGGTILVVEDDADTRTGLQLALEDRGYEVVSTADGNEALERLRSGPKPGVILLDLYMPGLHGYAFYRRLQDNPALASIPVIVVTAAAPRERTGLDVAAIIQKPIDLDKLLLTIGQVIARYPPT
jgi:two-component system chemotaxis response regulator CheY